MPRSGTAGSCDDSVCNLLRKRQTFSMVAEPFYILNSSMCRFQFLYILTSTCCFLVFCDSYPSG